MGYYRLAKFGDCKVLAPNLRQADKDEVWASHGQKPLQALKISFLLSEECNTIIGDNEDIIGMFGVTRHGKKIGIPWLLMSEEIYKPSHVKQFIPQSIEWVKKVQERYDILVNYVAQDNTKAIRWLRLLGFTFISLEPNYGVNPKPFYEFVRIRS